MLNNEPQLARTDLFLRIFKAVVVLAITAWIGFFVYGNMINENKSHPFKLGLDLAGGAQLVYEADTSNIDPVEVPELMNVLRDVIEQRINVFGVSEPVVYVESSSFVTDEERQRLVVELPGVIDVDAAVAEIGRTPLLEFKLLDPTAAAAQDALLSQAIASSTSNEEIQAILASLGDPYIDTGLTGRYLEGAQLEFAGGTGGQLSNEPVVSIRFNEEGGELFAQITRENIGTQLAIFLDGELISAPQINESIVGGTAIISGGFNPEEARELAQNLSFGALPVPIELASTQTIGGALGEQALVSGVKAGVIGFVLLSIFMIAWYRLPGLIAVIALSIYIILMLALFQWIPVVVTAAGIAGLILSVGLAVDANVLIAERIKEEIKAGKGTEEAIAEGFGRAWLAIRDANVTSLIAAVILFWFGTSLIKGFALVLGVGIVVSIFSAVTISRTLLIALPINVHTKFGKFLMSSGLSK